jgi:hypothetical protein
MFLYVYMSTTVSQRACINSGVSAKTAAIRCCAGFHNEGERTKCLSLKYIKIYTYIYIYIYVIHMYTNISTKTMIMTVLTMMMVMMMYDSDVCYVFVIMMVMMMIDDDVYYEL